jgi:hypothetical protein
MKESRTMGKPGKHAARLKALLEEHDKAEAAEMLQTAKALGDASEAGDEETAAKLADKVEKKGWLK